MRRRVGAHRALAALCLAAGACAGNDQAAPAPAASAEPAPWFTESAAERGLVFTWESGYRGRYLLPEIMGGGAALFDLEGDGDLDAYLVQGGALEGPPGGGPGNRLFENTGGGWFRDVTAGSGADVRGYGMGVAAGDYDGDGDTDLYVTNVGPNVLLRNDGAGPFTDVTAIAGVGHPGWSTSSAFLDYDGDGDLDLYVANYLNWTVATELDCFNDQTGRPDYCSPGTYDAPAVDALYRNEGDGTFTDVTARAGIDAAARTGLGVVCGDFTGDGRIDIFVADDGMMNLLWVNQGGGRFRDEALRRGCAVDEEGKAKAGMGVTAADLDDDGDLDLLVCNLRSETDSLHRNEGGAFSDGTARAGLATTSRPFTRFGMAWIDFDNDGWLDLYQANGKVTQTAGGPPGDPFAEPNLLFRGTPGGRFEEVLPRGATVPLPAATSRAAAFGDVDDDGAVDILVVNRDAPAWLLLNRAGAAGDWVAFRVVDEAGRVAVGATVTFSAGGRTITRDVRTAYSYLASNDPRVHVGLGDLDAAHDVTVRWPDGTQERFGTLPAGRTHTLHRGRSERH